METHTRRSILIVVPVFQSVYPRPFKNFLGLALSAAHREGGNYRFDVHVPEREILHSAMNNSVTAMLKGDYDYKYRFGAVGRRVRRLVVTR